MAADIQYIDEVPGNRNWLEVRLDTNERVSVHYGIKVEFLGRVAGRDTFNILEGTHEGKKASVSQKSASTSYLTKAIQHEPGGQVLFDLKSQQLKFGGSGPFNAFSGSGRANGELYTPVPVGRHELAIPAYPSGQTRVAYDTWTRFHKTWFRIGLSPTGSRFLHPGQISDGCVTVRQFLYDGKVGSTVPSGFEDLPRVVGTPAQGLIGLPVPAHSVDVVSYDKLYRYLILRRASTQSVGTIVVTDNGRL